MKYADDTFYVFFFSQICLGIDLGEESQKSKFSEEYLPEAINNLFLVTRRIQARHGNIPDRPVCYVL